MEISGLSLMCHLGALRIIYLSISLYKCVFPKDINKEKCLHTTVFPFQRIYSKSENHKDDENLFEGHGRSGFEEAR